MKYKIEKFKDHYRADCIDLPGSPPVGLGSTETEAAIHLFTRLIIESKSRATLTDWLQYIDNKEIIINDKQWFIPESYLKT